MAGKIIEYDCDIMCFKCNKYVSQPRSRNFSSFNFCPYCGEPIIFAPQCGKQLTGKKKKKKLICRNVMHAMLH